MPLHQRNRPAMPPPNHTHNYKHKKKYNCNNNTRNNNKNPFRPHLTGRAATLPPDPSPLQRTPPPFQRRSLPPLRKKTPPPSEEDPPFLRRLPPFGRRPPFNGGGLGHRVRQRHSLPLEDPPIPTLSMRSGQWADIDAEYMHVGTLSDFQIISNPSQFQAVDGQRQHAQCWSKIFL